MEVATGLDLLESCDRYEKGETVQVGPYLITCMDITPRDAKESLKNNHPRNRPISKAAVDRYANELKSGQWQRSGDPFRYNEEGLLIDGQHRLTACVKTGQTIKDALIIENLPSEAFLVIDQGVKRTAAQALWMSGEAISRDEVSIIKNMHYDLDSNVRAYKLSNKYFAKILANVDGLKEAVRAAAKLYSVKREAIPRSDIRAMVARAYFHTTPENIASFLTALDTGVMSSERDIAAIKLRNEVHSLKSGTGQEVRRYLYRLTMVALYWYLNFDKVRTPKSLKDEARKVKTQLFPVEGLD